MSVVYKVELSDGTVIDNLDRYAAYFVSRKKLTEDDFAGKTDQVAITWEFEGESETEVYLNMELADLHKEGSKWHFLLNGVSDEEMRRRETAAQLDDVITALMELAEIIGGAE